LTIEGREAQVFISGTSAPDSIQEIAALRIPTFQVPVRLDEIASVKEVLKPTSITSERGNRTARVSLAPEGENLGAISATVDERLKSVELPAGVEASVGGAATDQAESFEQLGLAMLAAIAIVYIVMVATFGSLLQPLLLLISIPFAATGALGLLLITDTALGVPALIGMLMLIGIVVTNAIVLIDLVNQYRKQGRSVEDSLISGARQRLRPIIMTALATIFALFPMALGLTGDSGFISKPLAIVVIGGLFSSTVLTLVLVPVLYWLVEGRAERKALRQARKQARLDKKAAKAAGTVIAKPSKKEAKAAAAASAPAAVMLAEPVVEELAQTKPEVVEEAVEVVEVVEAVAEVIETPETADNWENAIADQLEQESAVTAEPEFTPVRESEAPALAWSLDQDNVELDNETQMNWKEPSTDTAPIPAVREELPKFVEEAPAEPTKAELRDAKKQAKADLKAQKRAAKESRHSND
jgi:HAE1 family hydrophobic/amphiphilic exporter-1